MVVTATVITDVTMVDIMGAGMVVVNGAVRPRGALDQAGEVRELEYVPSV